MAKRNLIFGSVLKLVVVKNISQLHMLVDFEYPLLIYILALKCGTSFINIKMMLWQNFHGKIPIFGLSGGFQS